MGAPLLTTGSQVICPHAGPSSAMSSNTRVLASNQPVTTFADVYTIAGCAFTLPNGKPQPCVTVQWLAPATRVFINGQPALLQSSSGLCKSAEQIPQGPPNAVVVQPRVTGI